MKYNLKIGLLRVVVNQSFRQNSERVERAIVIVVILAEHLNLKINRDRLTRWFGSVQLNRRVLTNIGSVRGRFWQKISEL